MQVICKERGLGLSLLVEKANVDVLPLREVAVRADRSILAPQEENLVIILSLLPFEQVTSSFSFQFHTLEKVCQTEMKT